MIALVDCNAFFCSCEILFKPHLRGQAVGVLSNNDGCFVSRTNELKKLGVQMGQPYFKVKDICEKHNVHVFSSNYSLYSNMSKRVMATLKEFSNNVEEYSIDEAFIDLSQIKENELFSFAKKIKQSIYKKTGIPVGVGVAKTKLLAKLANNIAKTNDSLDGVFCLNDTNKINKVLKKTDVQDLWGVGRGQTKRLNSISCPNADRV